jgi:hypothetical protein
MKVKAWERRPDLHKIRAGGAWGKRAWKETNDGRRVLTCPRCGGIAMVQIREHMARQDHRLHARRRRTVSVCMTRGCGWAARTGGGRIE